MFVFKFDRYKKGSIPFIITLVILLKDTDRSVKLGYKILK